MTLDLHSLLIGAVLVFGFCAVLFVGSMAVPGEDRQVVSMNLGLYRSDFTARDYAASDFSLALVQVALEGGVYSAGYSSVQGARGVINLKLSSVKNNGAYLQLQGTLDVTLLTADEEKGDQITLPLAF